MPECVGKTTNYTLGAVRRSPPELPGGFIELNLQDQSGQALGDAMITVRIEYDPPYEKFNFSYEISAQEIDNNRLYLVLPPPDYPSRAFIQATAEGHAIFQTIVVSGQQFWEHVSRRGDEPLQRVQVWLISTPVLIGGGILGLCNGGAYWLCWWLGWFWCCAGAGDNG
jgi:hypothetical protein